MAVRGVDATEGAAEGASGGVAAHEEGDAVAVEAFALFVELDPLVAAEGLDTGVDGPDDGGEWYQSCYSGVERDACEEILAAGCEAGGQGEYFLRRFWRHGILDIEEDGGVFVKVPDVNCIKIDERICCCNGGGVVRDRAVVDDVGVECAI